MTDEQRKADDLIANFFRLRDWMTEREMIDEVRRREHLPPLVSEGQR